MPIYEQGTVDFPGVLYPIAGKYTVARGISPGIITIKCCNQPIENFDGAVGTVTFRHRDFYFEVVKARIFNHSLDVGGGEKMLTLSLEDRRWLWRYPVISGCYNRRTADQTVYKPYRKNPQELAQLLLKAMGETSYDVSVLPINDYPEVQWYATNAACELEKLANLYGCCTVMDLNNNILIREIGVGQPLPNDIGFNSDNEAIEAPILPDSYEVHFGPTKFRVTALIKEQAIDVDGKIKPAADVAYVPLKNAKGQTPTKAWQDEISGTFPLLLDRLGGEAHYGDRLFIMDLARKSVFKYYQITTQNPDGTPLKIIGSKLPIVDIDQLLPIDDTLYNVALDENSLQLNQDRFDQIQNTNSVADRLWDVTDLSLVYGTFFKEDGRFIATARQTSDNAFTEREGANAYRAGGYQVDKERGIVMFDDYVYKLKNANDANNSSRDFPDLAISFMTSVRDKDTGEFDHYVYKKDSEITNKRGTEPMVILKLEYQLVVTHELKNGVPSQPREVNRKMLDEIAEYYIRATQRAQQMKNPQTKRYTRLAPIQPDGAISSVTFEVGASGATTTAYYNDERNPWVQSYESRRTAERTAQGINQFGLVPPAFFVAPRAFPYNMGTVYSNVSPSRR